MKVSKCMTRDVQLATPTQSIRDAARMMLELDAGALPVQQDDRLVGMITDRDIALRAVAAGKSPETPIREIMSREVLYCYDDQELKDIARNMGEVKVRRRLPEVGIGYGAKAELFEDLHAPITSGQVAGELQRRRRLFRARQHADHGVFADAAELRRLDDFQRRELHGDRVPDDADELVARADGDGHFVDGAGR